MSTPTQPKRGLPATKNQLAKTEEKLVKSEKRQKKAKKDLVEITEVKAKKVSAKLAKVKKDLVESTEVKAKETAAKLTKSEERQKKAQAKAEEKLAKKQKRDHDANERRIARLEERLKRKPKKKRPKQALTFEDTQVQPASTSLGEPEPVAAALPTPAGDTIVNVLVDASSAPDTQPMPATALVASQEPATAASAPPAQASAETATNSEGESPTDPTSGTAQAATDTSDQQDWPEGWDKPDAHDPPTLAAMPEEKPDLEVEHKLRLEEIRREGEAKAILQKQTAEAEALKQEQKRKQKLAKTEAKEELKRKKAEARAARPEMAPLNIKRIGIFCLAVLLITVAIVLVAAALWWGYGHTFGAPQAANAAAESQPNSSAGSASWSMKWTGTKAIEVTLPSDPSDWTGRVDTKIAGPMTYSFNCPGGTEIRFPLQTSNDYPLGSWGYVDQDWGQTVGPFEFRGPASQTCTITW